MFLHELFELAYYSPDSNTTFWVGDLPTATSPENGTVASSASDQNRTLSDKVAGDARPDADSWTPTRFEWESGGPAPRSRPIWTSKFSR